MVLSHDGNFIDKIVLVSGEDLEYLPASFISDEQLRLHTGFCFFLVE